MNKNDLITQVAKESKLTKTDANKAIDVFIETITKTLKKGDDIRLTGFGTFTTANRAATEGRNPRTGQKIKIAATRLPKFRAGKLLKEAVAKR
jgi:DNA-binding protein HU-beta